MFSLIKELFSVLSSKQRSRFLRLQILVILMTIAEVASVAAIGPFMLLVANIDNIQDIEKLRYVYELTQAASPAQFVFYAGIATLVILFLTSCISIFTVWKLSQFSAKTGAELSNRLFRYYLSQDWLYHCRNNSSSLSNKITAESNRVSSHIIQPLMNLNAKILLAAGVGFGLFFLDPWIAIFGISLFSIAYSLIFISIRSRLTSNSESILKANRLRFRKQMEGLGGIRDILLLHRQRIVVNQFKLLSNQIAKSIGHNTALSLTPRYFMEFIAVGVVIFLVIFLTNKHEGSLGDILPILAIYGLAGLKLLPAFQQCYQNISTIRGAKASFDSIKKDLYLSIPKNTKNKVENSIRFDRSITLNNILFSYLGDENKVIDGLSLTIKKNQTVAFVGASGSGKSTLIDIISGLLLPQSGHIRIDDKILDEKNMASWQKKIGIVSQSIFLTGGSIRENIAFGLPEAEIDDEKVNRSLKLAHLNKFVESLEHGIYTSAGERGSKLSGGQRQRVGIARALYHDADVLIFDEATSALDNITEKNIMDSIQKLAGTKTIIMIAHRLTTIRNADFVFLLDQGKIYESGSFDKLQIESKKFLSMIEAASN